MFVQRVGIPGVTVLVTGRFQEANSRKVIVGDSGPEVGQIVLVIGLVGLANHVGRGRGQVVRVGRTGVIHEWFVVGAVVGNGSAANVGVSAAADRRAVICRSGSETTLEPAPGHILTVKHIPDVFAGHTNLFGRAIIVNGVRVADDRAIHHAIGKGIRRGSVGLPGD